MRRAVSNGGSDHVARLWLENLNREQSRNTRTVVAALRAWTLLNRNLKIRSAKSCAIDGNKNTWDHKQAHIVAQMRMNKQK